MFKQRTGFATTIISIILTLLLSISAFAATEAAPQTDYDSLTDFKIHVDVPESFIYRVEVYLDYTPFALTFMPDAENYGYDMSTAIKDGTYKVHVMSSDDTGNFYDYNGPETFNPKQDKILNITITENDAYYEIMDDSNAGDFEDEEREPFVMRYAEPEIIDLSEGGEYGTLHIQCRQYSCFSSVTYTLIGNGRIYEIPLNNDNLYYADVLLPPGSYYETQLDGLTLEGGAYAPEEASFIFAHEDNMSFWGNYYQVEVGGEIDIKDIIILMEYQGSTSETDPNILYSSTYINNLVDTKQKHVDEKLQEFFPELYEDEPETIPEVAEQEAVEGNSINLKVIIAAVLVILLIIGIILYIVIVYV